LQEKIRHDSLYFAEKVGINPEDTPIELVNKVVNWLDRQPIHREVWVIKSSIVKATLKKHPSKVVMKTLGLRSVDSMLKRNSPCELLPIAMGLEKPEWRTKFRNTYKKLRPNDFQVKEISIHIFSDTERIKKLKKAGFPTSRVVSPNAELGGLLVIPPNERFEGDTLAVAVSLIEAIADIRRYSAYYRALSVRKDFGQRIFEVSEKGILSASSKLSHVGWNSLHKHLIGNKEFFENIEQPYFEHNDLHVSSAAGLLQQFDPKFGFWNDRDYVFYFKDNYPAVSMNIIDVVTNYSNRRNYSDSFAAYGRARLWEELWSRYLSHEPLAEEVSKHFLGEDKL
jgi:hypothetical protein